MTWHLDRLAVLDTETTAPDPEEARLVTYCVGAVSGGLDADVRQEIVNPGVEIPQGAIDVHGVTNERAQAEGVPPDVAVEEVLDWLAGVWAAGMPVVAFNAAYDLTVIDREARRHLGRHLDVTGPVIDPFVIDRAVDKYRRGKRTLTATAQHYGVRLGGAHDATEDALAAARVAWRIAQQYPEVGAMSLADLYVAQAGWHRERQEDFARYLAREGKPTDDVSMEWPLRLLPEGVTV